MREHQNDRKYGRNNTVLTRFVLKDKFNMNYNNTKKLSSYNNYKYAYYQEKIEVLTNNNICNDLEHFTVYWRW